MAEMVVSLVILMIVLGGLHNLMVASDNASLRLRKRALCAAQATSAVEQAIALGHEEWSGRVNESSPSWSENRWTPSLIGTQGMAMRIQASHEPDGAIRIEAFAQWADAEPLDEETWRSLEESPAVRARALGFVTADAAPLDAATVSAARGLYDAEMPTPTPRPTATPTPTPPATVGAARAMGLEGAP